ncbi:MAG: hypothetical protein EPN97_08225 [Alphaproteobacteria bacterium]|nr:MAG: hypothetical protein EPN97_08225 [Alphaproteobacteria bacterium]
MAAVQDQAENSSGAFNRAAKSFGSWLYQQRHGKHDTRKADMLARVATFPGGQELLQKAAKRGVSIVVAPKKEIGSDGYYDAAKEPPEIGIANSGNPAAMAMALWHELRHMRQHEGNPAGMAFGGQLKDPRTAHLMGMMAEADAFTAETLMALQQKKSGNPEYFDAMFSRPDYGPHRYIAGFLRQQPYESFKDDAAFARALFTGMMTEGLLSYRASYFSRLGFHFRVSEDLAAFRRRVGNSKQGGIEADAPLAALYGPGFMSVSPKALMAAFYAAQPADERQALRLAQNTVNRADRLTEQEFRDARQEVIRRTQEIYMKDPDEYHYPGAFGEKVTGALKNAAEKDSFTGRPRRGRSP